MTPEYNPKMDFIIGVLAFLGLCFVIWLGLR